MPWPLRHGRCASQVLFIAVCNFIGEGLPVDPHGRLGRSSNALALGTSRNAKENICERPTFSRGCSSLHAPCSALHASTMTSMIHRIVLGGIWRVLRSEVTRRNGHEGIISLKDVDTRAAGRGSGVGCGLLYILQLYVSLDYCSAGYRTTASTRPAHLSLQQRAHTPP